MRLLKTLITLTIFVGCQEIRIEEIEFQTSSDDANGYLSYASLDDFVSDLKSFQVSANSLNEFCSYEDKMNELRKYVHSGSLETHEDAISFLEKHELYYNLKYDEDGDLEANEVLKGSRLGRYLNVNGEIMIGDIIYTLSDDDLALKAQSADSNSRINNSVLSLNDCLLQSYDDDCEPVDIIGSGGPGSGSGSVCPSRDFPGYFGCSKGKNFTTYTNGDERIKYKFYHISSLCRVQFQLYMESQDRFLRIWWPKARPLRAYAAEKVKYVLADGTPGETIAESGIQSMHTAYFTVPVWVVPTSRCGTLGGSPSRCDGAQSSHYQVAARWFWIDDPTGAGVRTEKCNERELCTVENGGCLDSSGQRIIYVDTNSCNNCPGICINGICTEIEF